MPRETISQPGSRFEVEVCWGNGQDEVTVGSVCRDLTDQDTGASRIFEYVNGLLAEAGMPQVGYDELREKLAAKGLPVREFGGWHAGFTQRRRVNELIEVLQRARNGAFGKDA